MNIQKIHQEIEKYNSNMLECDGMTRVASYILSSKEIPHRVFQGGVLNKITKESIVPHWWIQSRELTIDYKLNMWLKGKDIPYGIFEQKDFPHLLYDGQYESCFLVSKTVFEVLTTLNRI